MMPRVRQTFIGSQLISLSCFIKGLIYIYTIQRRVRRMMLLVVMET